MYGSASPSSVERKTRIGSAIRRRASRRTRKASPSQPATASKTAASRAMTNPFEWKRSWRVVIDDARGRSITAEKLPAPPTPKRMGHGWAGFSDRGLQHNVRGVAGNQGRNGRGPQRRQPSRADIEFERMLFARHGRLRRRNRKRRSILLFGALLLASLIALLLATVAFTGQQILLSQCNLADVRPLALGENSFLYTDNGQQLGVVPSATNRQRLPLSQISPSLPQATVAIEDARFWQHGALDYQGILRAF